MAQKESDFQEHKHDLVMETFQPGWEKGSVSSVTSQIGHTHEGNTPDHYHQVAQPGGLKR
jgi:hypothetical protein